MKTSFISVLLLSLFTPSAFAAPLSAAERIHWEGEIAIWKKKVCRPGGDCGLPEQIHTSLPAAVEFSPPSAPGSHLVADHDYVFRNWTASVSLYWVNPKPSDSAPPYIVTQIRLTEKVLGVVAECSRYDGVAELRFLPPGSCAGRDGAMLYGVSVMSPR